MAKDPTAVTVVEANSDVLFADANEAFPADADTAFAGTWLNVGYLPDPPDFSRDPSITELKMWNALQPVRTLVEEENIEVALKLAQTTHLTVEAYWGTGTWSAAGSGEIFTPDGGIVEKALAIEVHDGVKVARTIFGKVGVTKVGKLGMDKAKNQVYEVTVKRLESTAGVGGKGMELQYNYTVPAA